MKKLILALAILGTTLSAFALSLDESDLTGRIMIVNQEAADLMISMEVTPTQRFHSQDVKISGYARGVSLKCSGTSEYVRDAQTLMVNATCDNGQSTKILLDISDVKASEYLQGGLSPAGLTVMMGKAGRYGTKAIFGGRVDVKKLN